MTDIRETLNEIEVSIDHHPWVDGQWHVYEAVHSVLAALRAVLEIIDKQPEYTCETSWLIGQIHQAINAALDGAQ